MRKILVATVLALISITPELVSQTLIGVLGGINHTSLSGDTPPSATYRAKLGFAVSAVADLSVGDDIRLSFQPGFARLGTGIAVTHLLTEPVDTLNFSLDYLVLPVLGRVVAKNGVTFVTGGLQAAVLLKALSIPVAGGANKDITSAIADVDLAMILGAGAQFPISGSMATIELRYVQSLVNAGKTTEAAEVFGLPPRFRLSGFQMAAGLLFSL